MTQPAVFKLERRADVYVSSLLAGMNNVAAEIWRPLQILPKARSTSPTSPTWEGMESFPEDRRLEPETRGWAGP